MNADSIQCFFNAWGIVIQTGIAIVFGAITVYIMCAQLKNRTMMNELKKQTKSINDQLLLMLELNPPCLVFQPVYDVTSFDEKIIASYSNVGRDMYDLKVKENSGGRFKVLNQSNPKFVPHNSIIELSFNFEATLTSKLQPKMTLQFQDARGVRYEQFVVRSNSGLAMLSGSILIQSDETT